MGLETGDDAAVIQVGEDLAVVHTIDFFMPIVDNPRDFGRIAAANSLSDVYAMGGRPLSALAVLGLPINKLGPEVGAEILAGGGEICREAGIQIVGGHSIDDTEPKFGLAVMGLIQPSRILRNSGGRAGDLLVLTKALGVGSLTTALKRGALPDEHLPGLLRSMTTLNAAAAKAAQRVGVHAATDVTGFGLLGHLWGMVAGAGLGAEIWVDSLPVLPGAREALAQGIAPGATRRNLDHYAEHTDWDASLSEAERKLVADPQTSGGLLLAVPPERAEALVAALVEEGAPVAAVVGRLMRGARIQVRARQLS